MKLSVFTQKIATAIYLAGMTQGTFDERVLWMKSSTIGLVAENHMKEEVAARCFLMAVRMMQRIEDAPANLNTRDPRFQKNIEDVG